ncbi:MAG TPA: helix-turn-helix domain-containing protein [Cellulomonas sp.]|uniref:helix-turn-helix transcriptional regulator n=1 Tax=Cellulomonas sp. TaxID=40001 RepID=UPI002E345A84|nr:helix-turn-helix domain-containing protein [Cellulomonas sp.]HEX5333861.1 helix-turn-helix domain-containing protein [Cellulomonas sp.]
MHSEPIDLSSHKALAGVSRVAILEVLRGAPDAQDVQAIAAQVGLHPNTVRTHLDQLVDAGLVESSIEVRTTPGRPRVLFRASAAAPAAEADSYKLLAGILASTIDAGAPVPAPGGPTPGGAAAEAGRRWGRTVVGSDGPANGSVDVEHGVARIVALLDDVGFEPRLSAHPLPAHASQGSGDPGARGTVIELHRCPFRDVAVEHSDVVCGVHLGLMQGALEQMGAPATSIRLEPFVRPGLCLAHLSSAGPTDPAGIGGAA